MKSYRVTIQIKATEQYFPVVLFIMLYKVVPIFESVDEILKCDHSNESYRAVLSCGAVCCTVQGGSTFQSVNGPVNDFLKFFSFFFNFVTDFFSPSSRRSLGQPQAD